jgi:prepilin peptidase CpaA
MYTNGSLVVLAFLCLVFDLRERRIPNVITLPGAALGLVLNGYLFGSAGLLNSLKGFALGIGILFIPFVLGAMGGGDVKMLGMIGALKGTSFVLGTMLYGAVAGGILALVLLAKEGELLNTLRYIGLIIRSWISVLLSGIGVTELHVPRERSLGDATMPYGVALFAGVVAALIWW